MDQLHPDTFNEFLLPNCSTINKIVHRYSFFFGWHFFFSFFASKMNDLCEPNMYRWQHFRLVLWHKLPIIGWLDSFSITCCQVVESTHLIVDLILIFLCQRFFFSFSLNFVSKLWYACLAHSNRFDTVDKSKEIGIDVYNICGYSVENTLCDLKKKKKLSNLIEKPINSQVF